MSSTHTVKSPIPNPDRSQYLAVREICRHRVPELYFAGHFLPKPKRFAVFGLTAAVQQIIDIADPKSRPQQDHDQAQDQIQCDSNGCDSCESDDQRHAVCLAILDHLYEGKPTGKPELDGFHSIITQYAIPRSHWDRFVEGLIQRSKVKRYATWTRLREHLDQTTGFTARLGVRIFTEKCDEPLDTEIEKLISALGVGIGLTDVLTNLCKDWGRGRLMLPLDDLVRFKLSDRDLKNFCDSDPPVIRDREATPPMNERGSQLMRFQVDRARNLLRSGLRVITHLPDASARRAVAVLVTQYTTLLRQLKTTHPFAKSPRIGTWQRIRQLPAAVRLATSVG